MNYYAIRLVFDDDSNLFYHPESQGFVLLPNGEAMPKEWFFTKDDLSIHTKIVDTIVENTCKHHGLIRKFLTEIRPQDPDYKMFL